MNLANLSKLSSDEILEGSFGIEWESLRAKDDGKLSIYGIESLAVAIFTLFLPYIIFELNKTDKKYG